MTKDKNLSVVNYDDLQSKTMDWLRFPLMVAVCFIHTKKIDPNLTTWIGTYNIYWGISQVVARIAVPLFFVISGYYFFYNKHGEKSFTKASYKQKLKKRIHTLIIPYIIWNLFYLLYNTLGLNIVRLILHQELPTYDAMYFINAFTGITSKYPSNVPTWFLRNLIVTVVLSPIIYFLIKKLKLFYIFTLGILWLILYQSTSVTFISTFFFFSLGAYFSINNLNIIKYVRKLSFYPIIVYILFIIADISLKDTFLRWYIHRIGILIGMTSVLIIVSYLIEKGKIHCNKLLSESSFFMFVFHGLPIAFVSIGLYYILPTNDICMLFTYFFSVTLVSVVSVWAYKLLKRYFPKFTAVITGGR